MGPGCGLQEGAIDPLCGLQATNSEVLHCDLQMGRGLGGGGAGGGGEIGFWKACTSKVQLELSIE